MIVKSLDHLNQISKTISYRNINDFNEEEVNNIIKQWLKWFMEVEQNLNKQFKTFLGFQINSKGNTILPSS